ncbi:YusU family protein [Bacillus sp. ISL-40]|uniref:YusU family protein n=1 Tax=unclassified Bacillus (in: firmicutes) TaxID=185979 RepID=UPI001BE6A0FE|nr:MULTISPECIES: YusU family protein [unclassified Bacillus (in: firmicutes)]MBT2698073.1 YusU family protein [Bacillus sp. ISL-40]MBT2742105.1 YusU family protein [Bacillus sp. ISL-77]
MEKAFVKQFEALLEKYSELLVGEATDETREKVKVWALYSHIAKSMPALAKHWNGLYPDAKEEMLQIIKEIKVMNEQHRSSSQK